MFQNKMPTRYLDQLEFGENFIINFFVICTSRQKYYGNEIKDMHGRKKMHKGVGRQIRRKTTVARPRCTRNDQFKLLKNVDWIHVALNRDQWWVLLTRLYKSDLTKCMEFLDQLGNDQRLNRTSLVLVKKQKRQYEPYIRCFLKSGVQKWLLLLCESWKIKTRTSGYWLTSRHRASCILGQAFHYSPENAFYMFNQQIYFII